MGEKWREWKKKGENKEKIFRKKEKIGEKKGKWKKNGKRRKK